MHNRLQRGRPSEDEIQEGHSNPGPEQEFITKFHTIRLTAMCGVHEG